MGDPVVMVSLYPEFPQSVMSSLTTCGEFIFLVDRSGSMGSGMNHETSQSRMDSAKETLLFLLKSLPMGCYFNICSFETTFEHIFPNSVKYTQKTMENALKKVEEMAADLGGTEILQPLTDIYSKQCIPNHPRQLFVFSDGEVGNTKDVLDLVRKNSNSHRCLSFGIGEGASSALINGMAKEGGGHAQFITGTERMQPKVMESLRFALHPTVVDISLTWDLPKGMSATVLSPPIKSLFQGQRSVIYSQLSGKISKASEACVKVKYSLAGHPCENQLHFSLKPSENTGLTVHRLAARTLIHSLEMKMREPSGFNNDAKRKVVKLSVESGVNSSFTAFIAVDKTTNKVIQGPLVRRNVPTACLVRRNVPTASPDYRPLNSRRVPGPEYESLNPTYTGMQSKNYSRDAYQPLKSCRVRPDYGSVLLRSTPRCNSQESDSYRGLLRRSGQDLFASAAKFKEKTAGRREDLRCCSVALDDWDGSSRHYEETGKSLAVSVPPRSSSHKMSGTNVFSQMKKRFSVFMKPHEKSTETDAPKRSVRDSKHVEKKNLHKDPLLQLVSLQKASGSWRLDEDLAAVLGKSKEEVEKSKPREVKQEVWTTILALIWLHGFKTDKKAEWELLSMKAASWLNDQNASRVPECVAAGNTLLGSSVQKEALGI
ncbi:von Willebrand factor A domain-containing protein 5A-like [Poecilia reticulata]|uniref:von Willebrand factor A domain-containing protein 5A-like n=1 Tax=Poecilia reticulata TaxID=8081 RepID=UPI0007EA561A|nr:PREDICTED: von Willebrand factor A domain-containing protein 5A-like [Poecilia reticulata]